MPPFSLKNIDIQFPIGGFSIVAGPTGSGKSSLLSALIGEMTLVRGNIMVPTIDSRAAAAADENTYKDVIEISNEGLVLHDIAYCLLSKTKLMRGRTRVLITHHVPMCLPYADFMVMMNKGRVVLKGTPQDLKAQGVLTSALKELDDKASSSDKAKQPADENGNQIDRDFTKTVKTNMKQDLRDIKSEDEYTKERFQEIARQKDMGPDTDVSVLEGILVKEEEREKGRVKFETKGVITGFITNEQNMTSVERVMQYLKLDQEAASESTPENKPSALWPKTGNVEFENLVAEYVPGVPVLHGISLSVRHREKIGVVGRTGAGKSTMSLALTRFVEATKGRILLDGVDISKIGLEDLRRNITIIPQDPVLFNGTIRYNIDPFEEYPDELIWDALNRVHMTREQTSHATSASGSIVGIANSENGELPLERMAGVFSSLDDKIEQNGHSLSAGQRQLVAMARALVRRSKLIIMDEATASVDFDTDERLQRTIRGYEFANSTLLCIAHRLRTIIDYDRVLVLDKGKVAEFDTPKNLLEKKNGIFRGMCEKSGELEYLAAIANQ
ncbi:hypothetical protein LPJ72_005107 [Coemansia sp. Benny D160-2]|nr:hypothetical protein LPJ72_005107 [Coemansia sp. Benny D160-2]